MPSTAGMPWSITAWASEPMARTSSWTSAAAAGLRAAGLRAWPIGRRSAPAPARPCRAAACPARRRTRAASCRRCRGARRAGSRACPSAGPPSVSDAHRLQPVGQDGVAQVLVDAVPVEMDDVVGPARGLGVGQRPLELLEGGRPQRGDLEARQVGAQVLQQPVGDRAQRRRRRFRPAGTRRRAGGCAPRPPAARARS